MVVKDKILDGKALSKKIKEELKLYSKRCLENNKRPPSLAVILVGEDEASKIYVSNKQKACQEVGFLSYLKLLEANTKEEELLELIYELNENKEIDGILVQLPLPYHINLENVISAIKPTKDVDGFNYLNLGKLLSNSNSGFIPCTPMGIKLLLNYYNVSLKGKNITVVGAGFIVGKPLSVLLINEEATVSVCNKFTKDIKDFTLKADIVISATGVPHLIKKDMIKENAIVIDVGISRKDGKIVGDVDFEDVYEKASLITPVPGGVGPMTIASLLLNTKKAYEINNE